MFQSKNTRQLTKEVIVGGGIKLRSDSNNLVISGSLSQIKNFWSHMSERFGGSARLGDILDGSIAPERKLVEEN